MADKLFVNVAQPKRPIHAGTFGNVSVAVANFKVGAANDGAVSNGDVMVAFDVEAGTLLLDAQVITDAASAAATLAAGYRSTVTGSSNTDADFFFGATSIANASRLRADQTDIVSAAGGYPVLAEDSQVTLTVGGANLATNLNVTVILLYVFVGHG